MSPPASRDPEFWEPVIDHVKITGEVPVSLLKEKLRDPIGGMCYAQCPVLYYFFENKIIPDDEFPIKWFDNAGPSGRWESGGIHGIERVNEFHRIEVVWIGKKEQVIEVKDELMEKFEYIFNDILDLEWRTAWVTPWYMAQAGEKGIEETRERGTIDFEAYLPYRGPDRKTVQWLEFQNLSVIGPKYPDAFRIKAQSGTELWSGCSGIGLERWIATFLAQKGLNPENWPEKFMKKLEKLPKGVSL